MRIGSCFVGWRRKGRQWRKFRRMVGFRVIHGRVTRRKGSRRQIRGAIGRRGLRGQLRGIPRIFLDVTQEDSGDRKIRIYFV